MRTTKSLFLLSISLLLMVSWAGCNGGGGGGDTDQVNNPCTGSFECEGALTFCVAGYCTPIGSTPGCQVPTDCPDRLNQVCIDNHCLNMECGTGAPNQCDLTKNESCEDSKCIPECLTNQDCTQQYGNDNYLCLGRVCKPRDTGDEEDDQAEAEEEGVPDLCTTGDTWVSCNDFSASCLYQTLTCADVMGREWSYCEYYYIEGQEKGKTIYFSNGHYWRVYYDGTTYEAAGDEGAFCYFARPSFLAENELIYLDGQGGELGKVRVGNAYIAVTCPNLETECYKKSSMLTCTEFPWPLLWANPNPDDPPTGCSGREVPDEEINEEPAEEPTEE